MPDCCQPIAEGAVDQSADAEAHAMATLLEGLGLTSLIDVHTHFMPKRVMDKVWAYFDAAGPLTNRTWPIRYRLDEQTRVQTLRRLGAKTFTSLVYPHKPQMADWLNGWAAQFARDTPQVLQTATFYPEPGAEAYVRRAIDDGARVFKAHVQVGGYTPTDPLLEPVWEVLEHSRIPTVIHAGSGPAPGRFTGPGPVAEVLRRHPGLILIVAHMGLPEYREFLDLAHQHDGVHLDTTMVFTDFTEQVDPFPPSARADLVALADKIMFGSDYPNIPYPYHHAVESVANLGLGSQWCRKVLHDNASRLFGLAS